MDEVKIKSAFSRRMLSTFLMKMLRKKFGPGIEIYLNDLEIEKRDTQICPDYKIAINGELYVSQTVVEDLLCKKPTGSGMS